MCLHAVDPNKLPCFAANPIDKCKLEMNDAAVAAGQIVSLTLSFKVKTPLQKDDYIEFALPGFSAQPSDAQNVPVTATVQYDFAMMARTPAPTQYNTFRLNSTNQSNVSGCFGSWNETTGAK